MGSKGLPILPPRWKNCPPVGHIIEDIFIPYKTPLSAKFSHLLHENDLFDCDRLVKLAKPVRSILSYVYKYSIGLVIDLTKSKRFYNRKEFESSNVKYVKIECLGNEEAPTQEQVTLFIDIVRNFLKNRTNENSKIAVHCTHGFNRTGFLIVSYMVEELDFGVDAAVALFAKSREPGIYKEMYLKELFEKYGDPEDCPDAPSLPDWCLENEEDIKDSERLLKRTLRDDDENEINQESSSKTIKLDQNIKSLPPPPFGTPSLMPGVKGVTTLDQNSYEAHEIRELSKKYCLMGGFIFTPDGQTVPASQDFVEDEDADEDEENDDENNVDESKSQPKMYSSSDGLEPIKIKIKRSNRSLKFRGSQPVSMTRDNLKRLVNFPYKISYKADGTRYLMVIHGKDRVYLIDRGNFVYKVDKLYFPTMHWVHLRSSDPSMTTDFLDHEHGNLANCLLDGEMVLVKRPQDIEETPNFLIYDVVVMYDRSYGHRPFFERYRAIENHIIRPRSAAKNNNWLDCSQESFKVLIKNFTDISELPKLLDPNLDKTLGIELDGIIFQPSGPHDKYMLGTCPTTLKWKPPELNSVDFLVRVYRSNKVGDLPEIIADLYLGGQNTHCVRLNNRKPCDLNLDGKIVECTFDYIANTWKFLRVRTDKTEPNHITSGSSVVSSIKYPVTSNNLMEVYNFIRTSNSSASGTQGHVNNLKK